MEQKKKAALQLIEESLKELDSPKGSVSSAVQKLHRASDLVDAEDIKLWCAIQLGESCYTNVLKKLCIFHIKWNKLTEEEREKALSEYDSLKTQLTKLGLEEDLHYPIEELNIKADEGGGGYLNIGSIEEIYANLIKTKKGNKDGYYQLHLSKHINYVKRKTHEFASQLFKQLNFSETVSGCFDILKNAVDDRLLDINPNIAEQLMLAFRAVSSSKKEEWSQSLATCRRLLEALADELYPATTAKSESGKSLGQTQYINRLWAFMDSTIQSDSNKSLAKTHIDFLGSWLEKVNKITNKGVHDEVNQLEAVKAVFHTYLVVADILEYMVKTPSPTKKPHINTASLDEFEALLNIKRDIAKAIIKARVENGGILNLDILSNIKRISAKTLERVKDVLEFE